MDDYILVVVDMQPHFTSNPRTIKAVKEEVAAARRLGLPIILLEIPYHRPEPDKPYPRTYKSILRLVEGYDRAHVLHKLGEDGSRQVLRKCAAMGYETTRFRACGVKTDLCLLETVKGLLRRSEASVEVVKGACDTVAEFRRFCWAKFPVGKRLRLLEKAA